MFTLDQTGGQLVAIDPLPGRVREWTWDFSFWEKDGGKPHTYTDPQAYTCIQMHINRRRVYTKIAKNNRWLKELLCPAQNKIYELNGKEARSQLQTQKSSPVTGVKAQACWVSGVRWKTGWLGKRLTLSSPKSLSTLHTLILLLPSSILTDWSSTRHQGEAWMWWRRVAERTPAGPID